MNVLHVNPGYPFTALYARMLESFSDDNAHRVYVPLAEGRPLPQWYDEDDERIVHSRDYKQLHRLFYGLKTRKITRTLVQQIPVERFDLVHAHFMFSAGGVARLLKEGFGTPYVVSVRSTDVNAFFKYAVHLRRTGLRIMENAEAIIFINPSYRDLVLERYVPSRLRRSIELRTHVIPNGIDPFWLMNRYYRSEGPNHGEVALLFVGEFIRTKNVQTVVEVCNILRGRGYRATLDLVGDGPLLAETKAATRDMPHIRFHGRINSKEALLERYREADVFVMPSFKETFGLVYVEAMSQGLPVIYTRGEGIDGYFEDGTVGVSVDPRDPALIADRIEDALRDYNQISRRSTEGAGQFSWPDVTRRLEEIYAGALS